MMNSPEIYGIRINLAPIQLFIVVALLFRYRMLYCRSKFLRRCQRTCYSADRPSVVRGALCGSPCIFYLH